MKMFGVKYTLKNGQLLDVGIVAQNREQAVNSLLGKQKNVDSVIGINIGPTVHLFSKEINDSINSTGSEIKDLKKKNVYLKECLMDSDDKIVQLMNDVEKAAPVAPDTSEIEILHNKIVELETEKMQMQNNEMVDILNEKVVKLENENNDLKNVKLTEYVCLECGKKYKTFSGLEKHYNSLHKGK